MLKSLKDVVVWISLITAIISLLTSIGNFIQNRYTRAAVEQLAGCRDVVPKISEPGSGQQVGPMVSVSGTSTIHEKCQYVFIVVHDVAKPVWYIANVAQVNPAGQWASVVNLNEVPGIDEVEIAVRVTDQGTDYIVGKYSPVPPVKGALAAPIRVVRGAPSTVIPLPPPGDNRSEACRPDNLINCSFYSAVFVPSQSYSEVKFNPDGLLVFFNNQTNGSGIAFRFRSGLSLRGFSYLRLVGTSTREISFVVEYKVITGGLEPRIVKTSSRQLFKSTSIDSTITIPLDYDGSIDEIVINLLTTKSSGQIKIRSIQLLERP